MIGLKNKKGVVSIVIIAFTMMFLIMIILLVAIIIMYINTYTVVYNYKIDLYNLNRSAIISVNKVEGKYGAYEYDKDEYLNKFKELLMLTYNLDENLQNGDKFIKQIEILEYVVNDNKIEVFSSIKYEPIIFKVFFSNDCTYYVRNSINIDLYN